MIRFSRHARERLAERSITIDDVQLALGKPLEVIDVRYGRRAACSKLLRGRFLVIVYEEAVEDFIVVTALKLDRKGAKRYGFTRV